MPQLVSKIYIDAQTKPYHRQPFGLTNNQRFGQKAILPFCSWYNHRFQLLGAGELSKHNLLNLLNLGSYECMLMQISDPQESVDPNTNVWEFCRQSAVCIYDGIVYINGWFFYHLQILKLRQFQHLPIQRAGVHELETIVTTLRHHN